MRKLFSHTGSKHRIQVASNIWISESWEACPPIPGSSKERGVHSGASQEPGYLGLDIPPILLPYNILLLPFCRTHILTVLVGGAAAWLRTLQSSSRVWLAPNFNYTLDTKGFGWYMWRKATVVPPLPHVQSYTLIPPTALCCLSHSDGHDSWSATASAVVMALAFFLHGGSRVGGLASLVASGPLLGDWTGLCPVYSSGCWSVAGLGTYGFCLLWLPGCRDSLCGSNTILWGGHTVSLTVYCWHLSSSTSSSCHCCCLTSFKLCLINIPY